MKIAPNTSARLTYTLYDAQTGKVIEKTKEENPAVFNFGTQQLLPKFEEFMSGLKAGQDFDFIIQAGNAYGDIDPYAIFDIPLSTFEIDGKIDEQMIQTGNVIPMTDNEGNKHYGEIKKVLKDSATMDFNHPLAGKDLRFIGKIIEVTGSK